MATYAIGDLQGCLDPFNELLKKIQFKKDKDILWLTGDLINRGPKSLETLRKVQSLTDNIICVLGNHDISLLAYAHGVSRGTNRDFESITQSPDAKKLLSWLTQRPLLHVSKEHQAVLVHAGIPPCWTIDEADKQALLAHRHLEDPDFYQHVYGDEPTTWTNANTPIEKARFTINAVTRLRFLNPEGGLDFINKGKLTADNESLAWFNAPSRRLDPYKIFFGHWAALEGRCPIPSIVALDTGCVWGGALTAYCLENNQVTQVY